MRWLGYSLSAAIQVLPWQATWGTIGLWWQAGLPGHRILLIILDSPSRGPTDSCQVEQAS